MIGRIVVAVVVAFVVYLFLTFVLGPILETLAFAPAHIIGAFFILWGYALGICAGLYYFFVGYRAWNPIP